ncbi:ribonuclease PH [Buchnera aphidicola (Ceratoglyphina bambusae)]|uniref:ribonuclease PH n=1 Tax=Buchnera aphidicola TaxID=9 RepID=UPI0031B84660
MINKRSFNRSLTEMRPVTFEINYTPHADGSVLIKVGNTSVLCNASIQEKVPFFIKGQNMGWITAEYGMIPTSTHKRNIRESIQGKQKGRTIEIQRLISRSLRSAVNLKKLGERTILLDCDVLEADGGTRSASITGSYIAMAQACKKLVKKKNLKNNPINSIIASVSVGIVNDEYMCDLEYNEDSKAYSDINIVMNSKNKIVEIQGTAEVKTFSEHDLFKLISIAKKNIKNLIIQQKNILKEI